MHARLTIVHLRPDKAQEATDLFANSVVPAARAQAGIQGVWLFIDRATGKGVSLTTWDSFADMEAGEASGYYQEQIAKFMPLMTAPPTRETYEVAVQG